MHKRSKVIIAAFLSIGLVGSAIAYHKHRNSHHGIGGHFAHHVKHKLNHWI